jgi:hypothetical protein
MKSARVDVKDITSHHHVLSCIHHAGTETEPELKHLLVTYQEVNRTASGYTRANTRFEQLLHHERCARSFGQPPGRT